MSWPLIGLFVLSCLLQLPLSLLDSRWHLGSAIRKVALSAMTPVVAIMSRLPFIGIFCLVAGIYALPLLLFSDTNSKPEYNNLIIGGYSKLSALSHEQLETTEWVTNLVRGPVAYIGAAIVLMIIAAILCVILASLRYITRQFGLILKILADLIFYLGDNSKRLAIRSRLNEALVASLNETPVTLIICGHSLGSVVAVDCLRGINDEEVLQLFGNSKVRTILITGGSPLKRFFHSFFPERYPAANDLQRQLVQRLGRFEWYNVYRPYDPIGGALGLSAEGDIDLYKSREDRRGWHILNSHLNYWNDLRIVNAIRRIVASPTAPVSTERENLLSPSIPMDGSNQSIMQYLDYSRLIVFLSGLAIVALSYLWFVALGFVDQGTTILRLRVLQDASQSRVASGQLHGFLQSTVAGKGTYAKIVDRKKHCVVLREPIRGSGDCQELNYNLNDSDCVEAIFAEKATGEQAFMLVGEADTRKSSVATVDLWVSNEDSTIMAVKECLIHAGLANIMQTFLYWIFLALIAAVGVVLVMFIAVGINYVVQSVMLGVRNLLG